jgi:hypothetical protein
MSEDKALVPTEQRNIDFYGDELIAVLIDDQPYIPIAPICEYLGISWSGQRDRIIRDAVLSETSVSIRVTRKESKRGARDMLCLPLEYINGWLFGINASRVKEELKDKVIQYQRDCYRVLAQAFQSRAVGQATGSSLAHIRDMGLAIAQMAEQQMLLEQEVVKTKDRVTVTEKRLDKAADVVGDIRRRLRVVENRTRPESYITDEQAAEISLKVKALAALLRGHYQTVFSELYQRFSVASYKLIRREQYAAVLDFLEEWRKTAVSEQAKEN